jgi:hypothetical protein
VVEVHVPAEIDGVRAHGKGAGQPGRLHGYREHRTMEETDFMQTKALRQAIHAREGQPVLLLFAPAHSCHAGSRPRGAARPVGLQFLP